MRSKKPVRLTDDELTTIRHRAQTVPLWERKEFIRTVVPMLLDHIDLLRDIIDGSFEGDST